jgi:hypothetical protein
LTHQTLRGAETKLNRAREHMHSLGAEIQSFGQRHPQPVRLAIRDDPSLQLIPLMVESVTHPEPFMGAIVGDALHNLRSALDYMAWELVGHGTESEKRRVTESASQIVFPIISGPSKRGLSAEKYFEAVLPNMLPGIDIVHQRIVRQHQPYRWGDRVERHPLALLQTLSNTDKHREVRPVLWAPTTLRLQGDYPEGCEVLGVKAGPDVGRPLRPGAEIFYITVADKTRCDGLRVRPSAGVTITFEERLGFVEPVGAFDILEWIINEVADVLGEIDRVL